MRLSTKKTIIMSSILALPLISLAALPSAAQDPVYGKGDTDLPPGHYVWTIRNHCSEPIRFALNFQTGENRVVTAGWWSLPPQGEFRIPMNSEWIGYLAISRSEKFWWWDPNGRGPEFGADLARDFEFPGDGTRQGFPVYKFFWISVIEEKTTTLTCP